MNQMNNDERIKAIQEALQVQRDIMIETQAQKRQAQGILEQAEKQYKRAMEEKLNLQERLIELLQAEKQQQSFQEIISQTEAAKLLHKSKADVHQMVQDGKLKNYGNQSRFMVNKADVLNIKE